MEHPVEVMTNGFDRYVAARGGELWVAAWLLTGDRQHAEDLVQTALSKTYSRYGSFDNDHHFEAYVRTTMYRTYVSWWRRRSWRSEVPSEAVPERRVDDRCPEQRVDVLRALAGLPRMQRAVVTMRYLDDQPIAEVARALGISEGTVKKYAHRGCAALRESAHLAKEVEA